MKGLFGIVGLVLLGVVTWQLGSRMSTDAVSMTVGLVFGVLAGVPAALMIMLAGGTNRLGESANDAYARGWAEGEYAAELEMLKRGTKPAWMVEAEQERERETITVEPVRVRRTTTGTNGVQVTENHLLPPDVARRFGEGR